MDQCELEISRVHGLTEKTGNKGSFWIKYDLGYSKDEKIGMTCVWQGVYGIRKVVLILRWRLPCSSTAAA